MSLYYAVKYILCSLYNIIHHNNIKYNLVYNIQYGK